MPAPASPVCRAPAERGARRLTAKRGSEPALGRAATRLVARVPVYMIRNIFDLARQQTAAEVTSCSEGAASPRCAQQGVFGNGAGQHGRQDRRWGAGAVDHVQRHADGLVLVEEGADGGSTLVQSPFM